MEVFKCILDDIKVGNIYSLRTKIDDIKVIINNRDETGRTMLHWASFLGHKEIVSLLISLGADALLTSDKDENFLSIHFATVNNHTDCIQIFLDVGLSIESCDMFKRTPLSIACYYGRINASVFLLSKGANFDHRDLNGNNVLHFAAMSGNEDLCQILIYSGVDVLIKNDLGETAFHLASCKGSTRLLKSLLAVNGALLTLPDHKGLTAINLAKSHRNLHGYQYIFNQIKKSSQIFPTLKTKDFFYGRGGSKYFLSFLVFAMFFWAFPTYLTRILFQTYSEWPILNWTFIVFGLGFMVNLYAVNSVSPAYLPRFTKEYDLMLRGDTLRGYTEPEILTALSRLCHSCRAVRPLRASHCGTCRRCVRDKDHHCPYVFNCVGLKNRSYFLMFLACLWLELLLGICFSLIIYFHYDYRFPIFEYVGLFLLIVFFVFVSFLLASTSYGAFTNITTNESFKWKKYGYDYLRDSKDHFRNPFDKGSILNFLEFFRVVIIFKKTENCPLDI